MFVSAPVPWRFLFLFACHVFLTGCGTRRSTLFSWPLCSCLCEVWILEGFMPLLCHRGCSAAFFFPPCLHQRWEIKQQSSVSLQAQNFPEFCLFHCFWAVNGSLDLSSKFEGLASCDIHRQNHRMLGPGWGNPIGHVIQKEWIRSYPRHPYEANFPKIHQSCFFFSYELAVGNTEGGPWWTAERE